MKRHREMESQIPDECSKRRRKVGQAGIKPGQSDFKKRLLKLWNWFQRIEQKVDKIMFSFANLATLFANISAAITVIKTDVESLLASVAALKAQLASVPPPGLTADQQASLDDAVAKATAMAASLTAIDAEVNPPVVVPAPAS